MPTFAIAGISLGMILALGGVVSIANGALSLSEKLKGRILLQVESKGEAWYVRPDTGTRANLGRPADAFLVMRERGVGITNADIRKIPIGILTPELVTLMTTDATSEQVYNSIMKQLEPCTNALLDSGSPDSYATCYEQVLEKLVGMKLTEDSDRDGYDDITEILNSYDPFGQGKMPIDQAFTKKMAGRILIQVEQKGGAWYVDPKSEKRYFLGRPADAFSVMRALGLGISNADLASIGADSQTTPITQAPIVANITDAHTAFGIETLKFLAKEEQDNIFISPSSIALALSMVYNGAKGGTYNAMQNALSFRGFDINTINSKSRELIDALKNPDQKVELSVANSVWAKKGIEFRREFLDVVKHYFNAEISTLDFSNSNAANTINAWVNKNTKGKISSIVSPPIPDDMVMYLINAVYFKGSWTTEFNKQLTEERAFTSASGASKKHPLMMRRDDMPYFETEDFQSVQLPYGKNKRLSMVVFLPKNLDAFVQSLNADTWTGWMKQYKETEGTLLLPKFKMEYEKRLIPLLTKLGMGIAFENSADFTGIGRSLKISEVKHKTYVDVNEEGTEAAAVTGVGGVGITSVGPVKKTFYMEVNRPFFFAIRDNQTGEPLFMGIIRNP